jgi:hypothetical protein
MSAGAVAITLLAASALTSTAQTPPSITDWPATINANASVDYCILDPNAYFPSTPGGWNNNMYLPGGGDQAFIGITLAGLYGDQVANANGFLNIADPNYAQFVSAPIIDVLLQVYGDSALYANSVAALEGQVGSTTTLVAPSVSVPAGATNGQWNWMLLEVTNPVDGFGFGTVGDTSFPTTFDGQNGGVNNGTIRFGNCEGWTVRAIAWGPQGAFGTTNQINVFAAAAPCAPEPAVNLAYVDFNAGTANNLTVINNSSLGYTYSEQSKVGPQGDLRTAIQATSGLMNFGILSNYLGLPCNSPETMEVGIELYDDPALAGVSIVPSQYATDPQGDLASYSGFSYTLTGSGQWLKVAFTIPAVDLEGVNTAPLTGGPNLLFNGGFPYIDRVELGVYRTGSNALAGLTPDPNYNINPFVCLTNYGYYAEWNPSAGVINNLDAGLPTTLGGPTNDQRVCEAGQEAGGVQPYYLQFDVLNYIFGPMQQDNLDVVIVLTYYDDPALVGDTLYPQIYQTWNNGVSVLATPSGQYDTNVTLRGTGQWKDVTFEIPNANLYGVYGNPQAVCRYAATGPVCVSRVRYDVIRPCGCFQGIDYLQQPAMTSSNAQINITWRGTAAVQGSPTVTGVWSNVMTITNTLTNNNYKPSTATMTNKAEFFRLQWPAYPTNLLGNAYSGGVIQNGSFLANASLFTQWPGYTGYGTPPNPSTIAGWTSSGGGMGVNGLGVNIASGSPFSPPNSGDYTFAFIQGAGSLTQNLPLATNTQYRLSFSAGSRSGDAGVVFQVQVGDSHGVYFTTGTLNANTTGFANYNYTFTTPATIIGTPSIQLQNLSSGGVTIDFTDVGLSTGLAAFTPTP